VIGLFNLGGENADKEVLLACVLEILEVLDVNKDGEITRDEFVNNATKSGFINNLLGIDDIDDAGDE
jgi:Ca2+-binding EF-hand superfamily protein